MINFYQTKMNSMWLHDFFIEPKIISSPSFEVSFTTTADPVILRGCSIAIHFDPSETAVYWLKNGFEKSNFTGKRQIPVGGGVFRLGSKVFDVEPSSMYIIQGYYQCAVFDPRYMKEEVRSERLDVQFQGNIFIYLLNKLLLKK